MGYDATAPGSVAGGITEALAEVMPVVVEGSAQFTIPFTDLEQSYGWTTSLDPTPQDLSGKQLVVRLRLVSGFTNVEGCTGYGGVQLYAFSGESWDNINGWNNIATSDYGQWKEFTLDLVPGEGAFDPAAAVGVGYVFNTGNRPEETPAECAGATESVFEIDYIALRDLAPVGPDPVGSGGAGGEPGAGGESGVGGESSIGGSPSTGGAGGAPELDGGT